jgi:hypothetical protein
MQNSRISFGTLDTLRRCFDDFFFTNTDGLGLVLGGGGDEEYPESVRAGEETGLGIVR